MENTIKQEDVELFEDRWEFIESFTNAVMNHTEDITQSKEQSTCFVKLYDLFSKIPFFLENFNKFHRLAFIQTIMNNPEYLFRNSNIISVNLVMTEFDKAINERDDKYEFVMSVLKYARRAGLVEWSGFPKDMINEKANWNLFFDHLEEIATAMGWDGED